MSDDVTELEVHLRHGPNRYEAYYYGFDPTGVDPVDRILAAVARAGKMCHYTSDWNDVSGGVPGPTELIQAAANIAAREFVGK